VQGSSGIPGLQSQTVDAADADPLPTAEVATPARYAGYAAGIGPLLWTLWAAALCVSAFASGRRAAGLRTPVKVTS
jgi:hypothetical protein